MSSVLPRKPTFQHTLPNHSSSNTSWKLILGEPPQPLSVIPKIKGCPQIGFLGTLSGLAHVGGMGLLKSVHLWEHRDAMQVDLHCNGACSYHRLAKPSHKSNEDETDMT